MTDPWHSGVTAMTLGSTERHHPSAPIDVRLLGAFAIRKLGQAVPVRAGSKTQALIGNLALRHGPGLGRDELITLLWPASNLGLAGQALNTLIYSVHRSLGDALDGRQPIFRDHDRYRLDEDVVVDVAEFDAAADRAEGLVRARRFDDAVALYEVAASLYRGDLVFCSDVAHVIERERLRGRYLHVRAVLAEHQFARGAYTAALADALRILAFDPCREDAHRMAMRSYVRLGERAQAMRQYHLCRDVLAREFEAPPESATSQLYDRIRLDPTGI
jgi:DNA-binding SARP family transcriptional activator